MGLVCCNGFTAEVAELPCTAHSSAGFVFNTHFVCHADCPVSLISQVFMMGLYNLQVL